MLQINIELHATRDKDYVIQIVYPGIRTHDNNWTSTESRMRYHFMIAEWHEWMKNFILQG